MKANQRFTLLAVVVSCVISAGTAAALISIGPSVTTAVEVPQEAEQLPQDVARLRPTLVSLPEPLEIPQPAPVTRPSRFDFVHPDADAIELPDEVVTAAADPETWSVEVTERPVTSPTRRSASRSTSKRTKKKSKRRYTLKERLAEISPTALPRVMAKFNSAKVAWPPAEIALVAIKDKRGLELYARPENGSWSFVHRYKVLAASGRSGPKLLRGDRQVPEGVYRISYLNPNSAYHVSMRVNYPNAFDRKMAKEDGRKDLGGDIMIHGKNVSAGCIAVGDKSAEELFVAAAEVGIRNVKVVIAPTDFRSKEAISVNKGPKWVPKLYTEIASVMADYKAPAEPSLLSLLGF